MLGAIAQGTERLELITGVTCPTTRIPPAIVAQAAATAAAQMPGRFSLGVGAGANLNEHILGERWPPIVERQQRLEEAIEVIRELWRGELTSHRGAGPPRRPRRAAPRWSGGPTARSTAATSSS